MANTDNNTVVLRSLFQSPYIELIAGGTITPGHLVQRTATDTAVVHSTTDGWSQRMFAVEQGNGTIDTNYVSGDTVFIRQFQRGDVVLGLLGSVTVAIGDPLFSDGGGVLGSGTASTAADLAIVGVALEAVTGPARIRVEIS